MEIREVKVSDIVEYNPDLGQRCFLLRELGLNPYVNTEEEICSALEKSAEDPDCLKLCMMNSHCGVFLKSYNRGETPFFDKDPVRLTEYGGEYWVTEGKQRVCMAKRFGVETVKAQVTSLNEDYDSLLPVLGEPGTFVSTASYGRKCADGELAILWVKPPRSADITRFSFGPVPLNPPNAESHGKEQIIPGVSFEVTVQSRVFWPRKKIVTAAVNIQADHPNTRIWLYTVPAKGHVALDEVTTAYRRGQWRKKHEYNVFGFPPLPWPWHERRI